MSAPYETYDDPVTAVRPGLLRRFRPRRGMLLVRRLIAIGIVMGTVYGVGWFFLASGTADPVIAAVMPMYEALVEKVNAATNTGNGDIIVALAAFLLPHIGMIMFLFEDITR